MQFAALTNAHKNERILDQHEAEQFGLTKSEWQTSRAIDDAGLRYLPVAETYAWEINTVRAAWLASRSIPSSAVLGRAAFPYKAAWWWFDELLDIPRIDSVRKVAGFDFDHVVGLLLIMTGDWLTVIDVRPSIFGPMLDGFCQLPVDRPLPNDVMAVRYTDDGKIAGSQPSERTLSIWRFLVGATTWLGQRVAVEARMPADAHRARQIAYEHGAPLVRDIRVIRLRRLESGKTTESCRTVDWSCRWVVSGHWRNQPYPSKGETRLLYINPYIKGPDDKPLRTTHTVYEVNR